MSANRETTPDVASDNILTFVGDLVQTLPVDVAIFPPPDAHVGDHCLAIAV